MSARVRPQLDKNIIKFQFLCHVPSVKITPTLEQELCAICIEPYQNNRWKLGGTVHRPVVLPCGHILGFQCLARWILSANFNNRCSLCRAPILDPNRTRKHLNPHLASSFARLEILAVVARNGISRYQKMELLGDFEEAIWGEKALWVLSKDSDRVMVVWEEFLDMMCHDPAILDEGNPARLDEHVVEGREDRVDAGLLSALRDQVSRLLRRSEVRIGLSFFFFIAGVAIAIAGLLWDFPRAGEDTLIAMIQDLKASMEMDLTAWICGSAVGFVVDFFRIPWGLMNILGAVFFGLVLGLLVQKVEVFVGGLTFVRENL